MDKNNKVNNLIQSLVTSFKDYDSNLKNRFKVDSIFLGFEENANKNFTKLINLSDSRYKYVKFGVKLDNVLNRQKSKYKHLNDGIKNDKIYSSNILDSEKSKLFKSVVSIKNKEISDIRDKLLNTLRSTDNILHKKNKLKPNLNRTNKLKSVHKKRTLKIKITNNNSFHSPFEKKISNISKKSLLSRKQSIRNTSINKKDGQKLIDNIIKEDYKNFFVKINSYHNFLDKLKNISDEYYKGKGLKINKDNFDHILSSINPNSLKFLTYNDKYQPSLVSNEIKKDLEFDLKKIQKIKIIHDKNNNSLLKTKLSKSCRTEYNPLMTPNNNFNKKKHLAFESANVSNNSNNLDNFNTLLYDNLVGNKNKKHKTIDTIRNYNYKNTANIVYNEIENGLFYGESFINKRKTFNNYFNKCFYKENKKNDNNLNIRKNSNNNNINIVNSEPKRINSNEYINEIKEYQLKRRDNIRKEFQNIYDKKKIQWKKEEKIKELQKIKEMQKRKEIEHFLLNMQNKSLFKKD